MSNCKLNPLESAIVQKAFKGADPLCCKLFDDSCKRFDSELQQIIIDSDVSDLSTTLAKLSNYFLPASKYEDRTYEALRAMVIINMYIAMGLDGKSDRNKFDNEMLQVGQSLGKSVQAIVVGAKKHLCEKRGNNESVGKKTSN